ncbi:hypothetical protein Tco_0129139 [Tanacetum coccineum]
MRDENPIRTLGYYSKPSHEGYRNIIELLVPSPLSNNIRRILSEQGLDSRLTLKSTSTMRIESLLQCANINDRIDHTLKRTVDYAAGGRLRKMSAEKAWATIEELARYEDEGKVKQLEEYMGVIGSDFMQLSLEVVGKLKEEIRMEENRTKKIEKITREVPSFDEPEPQPQPLPNYPSLDVSLGDKTGPEPPIKPHSPNSFRTKVADSLTIHTPPSPHVASFHPKDMYCYYHP